MDNFDIRSAIRERISIRRYDKRDVADDLLQSIVSAGTSSLSLDATIPVRFHLARDAEQVAKRMPFFTGGKWVFSTAPHFILAISEERPHFLPNLGFRMEQMILYATHMGLGTCWIGGMFSEKNLQAWLGLEKHERVVAITPIGYPDDSSRSHIQSTIVESFAMMRGKRKPLDQIVFGPLWDTRLITEDATLLEVLECTRLAPSSVNSQPWRFLVSDKDIVIVAEPPRYSGITGMGTPLFRIDMGIAMAHLNLAANAVGWQGKLDVNSFDSVKIAAERQVPGNCEIFGIYHRNTNRVS